MTRSFDMVCTAGTDVGDPVQTTLEEASWFASMVPLLAAAYVPEGTVVSVEITPRAQKGEDDE